VQWNVELVDRNEALKDNVILQRRECDAVWSCNPKVGGDLLPGYHKCP
jgi:hypothetical protein